MAFPPPQQKEKNAQHSRRECDDLQTTMASLEDLVQVIAQLQGEPHALNQEITKLSAEHQTLSTFYVHGF